MTPLKAISIADLKPVGNRTAAIGRSYVIQNERIAMRYNRIARHVYGQQKAGEPWGFIGYANNEDDAKKLYVDWINLRLEHFL